MRLLASHLFLFVAAAAAVAALGAALLRSSKLAGLGWFALAMGLGSLTLFVLMLFAGRLGPENLWFRSPAFFVAATLLLFAAAWWLRRPATPALRFGLPAALLGVLALATLLTRLDGRSAPFAMFLPTLEARAPELSYFDAQGRRQTLAELRGHVVLLNFWATWCAPCRREMPMLSKLQREHADQGLVVLYVSLEDPQVLDPFLAANRFDGIQGRLDRAAGYYDAGKYYPLSYLISRDGRVMNRWSGRPREEWIKAQVAAQL